MKMRFPSKLLRQRRLLRLVAIAAIALFLWVLRQQSGPAGGEGEVRWDGAGSEKRVEAIERAFQERRSGVWAEGEGKTLRLLADDDEGSRHQRWLLELEGGHTLLIAHNIDLADRVPLQTGDSVAFRGRYEWNERGGVIHWTHDDPDRAEPGGWIRHRSRLYR